MEEEKTNERKDALVVEEGQERENKVYREDLRTSNKVTGFQDYESDPLSDHENNVLSDEDTESLTGSLDGVTGGDEYELTGDDTEYHSDPVTKHTKQEKLRMLALRRHLDLLSEQVLQNDYLVNQSREELKKCQENINSLENELDKTAKEIELLEIDQNKASLYRLKSHYAKLCHELDAEREVAAQISERLEGAEYSLSLATMEQGRFLLAGEELEKQEEIEMKSKAEASAGRIRKENITALAVERRRRTREKDHITALRERERKHRHALAMAKRNREQASKFLKETMTRVRLKEAEDEEFHRVDMEKRIKSLLSLKSNIESNKENLRAVEARAAHLRNQQEEKEKQERDEILGEGLNPDEVLTRRKRIRQFEKDKEAFEKRQRERQVEIVDKLLREEKQMKKRYQQQPQLWPEKQRERNKRFGRRKSKTKTFRVYSGSSSMEYSADAEDAGSTFVPSKLIPVSSDDEDEFSPFGHTSRDEEKEGDSDHEGEDLAEPEFRGLWELEDNKETKGQDKTDSKLKFTDHIPSKTEQEMMEKALTKQRENIVQKQVAVGREFKGQAFYSKPEVVVFKDFDVGKTYPKKVVLTNVSYTQNFCKYVGMSSHLLDFIDILYDPPGAMSAGLTCDFTVIFKPMLNEDLVGQIDFLSQTGPFSVPVQCLTKKCQVSVDRNELKFGSQVLGETSKKTIVLVNKGALGTKFHVKKVEDGPEASLELDSLPDSEAGSSIIEKRRESVEDEKQTENKRKGSKATNQNIDTAADQCSSPGNSLPSSREQQADDENEEPSRSEADDEQLPPENDDVASETVFTIGKVSSDEVLSFSSVQLEIIFAPVKPGDSSCEFEIIFDEAACPPIIIIAQGTGVDVPVWVEREVVDLKICLFDRLYQDAIVVNNRATSALRLKFEVCKDLKDHLELLPKTAYIQAEAQFSAQLKFLPRKSLCEDCPSYFNADTGILEAPLVIRVADQTRPVLFSVRAIITPADIEFSVQEVNFGYCTTVESVRQTITITNKSILPQMYGFCGVPECLEVQPNDGFGTLLPLESLDIDLIFSAKKAKEYCVDLVCKNGIGNEYHIPCKGVGVYPPLDLSHSVISFRATAVGDSSTTSISVINSHTNSNEFTHEVPRIGRGPVAEVGPTSFEFVVPSGAPVNISPAVGVVLPGQHCNIDVTFSPQLEMSSIEQEAVRIGEKMAEIKRKMSEENMAKEKAEEPTNLAKKQLNKPGKKSGKGSPKRGQTPNTPAIRNQATPGVRNQGTPTKINSMKDIVEDVKVSKGATGFHLRNIKKMHSSALFVTKLTDPSKNCFDWSVNIMMYRSHGNQLASNEFSAAQLSLLKSFQNVLNSYDIPCFVASGQSSEPGTLSYSAHNILYLKVHCPAVKPEIVVMSDYGRCSLDFGQVSVGQRVVKEITIQNVSSVTVDVSSSILDPHGPFELLNATRSLEPDATHCCVIAFCPQSSHEFYEIVDICSPRSSLRIRLKGRGVQPVVSSTIQNGVLDFGYALVQDSSAMTFKLENTSELCVKFNITLASLSKSRRSQGRATTSYLASYPQEQVVDNKASGLFARVIHSGSSNYHGHVVFDCVPSSGTIEPGKSQEFTVTFTADHPSDYYADELSIEINEDVIENVRLRARASSAMIYLHGWDELRPPEESLSETTPEEEEEGIPEKIVVLLLKSHTKRGESYSAAERRIEVGCIKNNLQTRKSCDFVFDNTKDANDKGFSFDPVKGSVEAGHKKDILCRWQPAADHDPSSAIHCSTVITLKGEVTLQYKVLLQGLIVSDD